MGAHLDDRTRFAVLPDDSVDDPSSPTCPFYVTFELRFMDPLWPPVDGSFGRYPEGITVWIAEAPCWTFNPAVWELEKRNCPDEHQFFAQLSTFFDDWFRGKISVTVSCANGVPYKWVVERNGTKIWSCRKLCYPYWGRRQRVTRRCSPTTLQD